MKVDKLVFTFQPAEAYIRQGTKRDQDEPEKTVLFADVTLNPAEGEKSTRPRYGAHEVKITGLTLEEALALLPFGQKVRLTLERVED